MKEMIFVLVVFSVIGFCALLIELLYRNVKKQDRLQRLCRENAQSRQKEKPDGAVYKGAPQSKLPCHKDALRADRGV
ncbi:MULTISPECIES: hypothetical protein [Allobaculum]|uniref:hypothetical protein n=1 Tax=Allobaculum TaxID=174708 RepID=UPI001E3E2EBF|nr:MULTISPECIES: hypothetical protein [Allobaculum]UNT92673.1 hypothetical protein KWG61_11155 [Allobaculum sp. Allo2]